MSMSMSTKAAQNCRITDCKRNKRNHLNSYLLANCECLVRISYTLSTQANIILYIIYYRASVSVFGIVIQRNLNRRSKKWERNGSAKVVIFFFNLLEACSFQHGSNYCSYSQVQMYIFSEVRFLASKVLSKAMGYLLSY